ncbi:MAG: rhomboid family intramembrane serine protease [Limisphaerales bacterium]
MQPFQEPIVFFTLGLIGLTCWLSYKGFKSELFVQKYIFSPEYILAYKEWYRMVSAGFLHANFPHLICNMVTLYLFGSDLELLLGPLPFLLIYFGSIVGGSLLSLWLHRHHQYFAYGASGGVCGVLFAHIFLFPGGSISMFLLPIWIPTWLYAILFVVGSFYGIKRQSDNIGHDAHLGGAIAGLACATLLRPAIVTYNLPLYLAVSIGCLGILVYLAKVPFLGSNRKKTTHKTVFKFVTRQPAEKKYNVDELLDKISARGIDSLTPEEQKFLSSVSEKFRRRAASKKPESDLYF